MEKGSYPDSLKPYWRYDYQKMIDDKSVGDPFEGAKDGDEKQLGIVKKGRLGYLVLNKFPYAPGHMLAVPYRAVGEIEELTPEEHAELMELVVLAKRLQSHVLGTDATNIGLNLGDRTISGGSVPMHLHWHIVPRWKGDHSFLPVVGEVRLLIRSQEDVREAFVAALSELEK